MRAIGVLMGCVVMLAILQISYHIVDAHIDDDHHHSWRITDDHEEARLHHHHHKVAQKPHVVKTHQVVLVAPAMQKRTKVEDSGQNRNTVGTKQDEPNGLTNNNQVNDIQQKLMANKKLCGTSPELCDFKSGSGNVDYIKVENTHRKDKGKQKYKNWKNEVSPQVFHYQSSVDKNGNKTIVQILHIHVLDHTKSTQNQGDNENVKLQDHNLSSKSNNTDVDVESKKREKEKQSKGTVLSIIYDKVFGDSAKSTKSSNNIVTSSGQRRSQEKGSQHAEVWRYHKKYVDCTHSSQCQAGECCALRKNGRKQCVKARRRAMGKRCTDSCLCQWGLECHISEYNARGMRKKYRHPNAPKVGRCMAQNKAADSKKGWHGSVHFSYDSKKKKLRHNHP